MILRRGQMWLCAVNEQGSMILPEGKMNHQAQHTTFHRVSKR